MNKRNNDYIDKKDLNYHVVTRKVVKYSFPYSLEDNLIQKGKLKLPLKFNHLRK